MGRKKTKDEFLKDLYDKYGNRFTLVGEYVDSTTKTAFKCNICKDIFEIEPRALLHRGSCAVCSGKKVLKGYNDLATLRPDITQYWITCIDDETLTPSDVTIGTHKKVLWKCPTCTNTYVVSISDRCTTYGCKNCGDKLGNKKRLENLLKRNGSLFDNYPDIAAEWIECISDENKTPFNTTCQSNMLVKWVCATCGNEWNALVSDRTNGHDCPVCSRKIANHKRIQKRIDKNGSLAEIYPALAKELLYFVDDPYLTTEEVTPKCHKDAIWQCKDCNHIWQTSVLNRANGSDCPNCSLNRTKSNLQEKVEVFLEDWYGNVLHERECSLKCYNPDTNRLLPYDNELYLYGKKIIVEVHGMQHYKVTGFHHLESKHNGKTAQENFEYQQWKDKYKKNFAIQNGYEYLEVPYWTEENDEYINLIANKMIEIYEKGD